MEQIGGFLNYFTSSSDKNPIIKSIKSETEFIDKYQKYLYAKEAYENNYQKHMLNLIQLDNLYDINKGLQTSFLNKIIPTIRDTFTDIDYNNPLLLRNYNITSDTLPSQFRLIHLKKQVLTIISQLNDDDINIISDVDIELKHNNVHLNININNMYNETVKIPITSDYLLDDNDIYNAISKVIKSAKKQNQYLLLKRERKSLNPDYKYKDSSDKSNQNTKYSSSIDSTNSFKNRILNKKIQQQANKKKYSSTITPNNNLNDNNDNEPDKLLSKNRDKELNDFDEFSIRDKENKLSANDKPLTPEQILHFQHQQVLDKKEEEIDGKKQSVFVDTDIIKNALDELLGFSDPSSKNANVKLKYESMPLEDLKKLDMTQLSKEELDIVCPRFSEDEEMCTKIKKCWYNSKKDPKCYRFKEKDET